MAGHFTAVYTREQKDALIDAYVVRQVRPARRVRELAAAGELQPGLDPFTVTSDQSIRQMATEYHKKRRGQVNGPLGLVTPEEAVAGLRKELLNAAHYELERLKRHQRRRQRRGIEDSAAIGEGLRQVARAAREAAALPTDGKTHKPGNRNPLTGQKDAGTTVGGLAGSIISSSRLADREPNRDPRPSDTGQAQGQGHSTPAVQTVAQQHSTEENETGAAPGAPSVILGSA